MYSKVKNFVKSCRQCQLNQSPPKEIGKMKPILIKKCIPFDYFQLDFIGSLSVPFKDNYVLVAVDKNTNYCIIEKTSNPTAEVVLKLVKK